MNISISRTTCSEKASYFSCMTNNVLLNHTTAQHFQPIIFEVHLQFKRRSREREVCIDPAHFHVAKQVFRQATENLFQIFLNRLHTEFAFVVRRQVSLLEQPHTFHLVEDWIVRCVDLVTPASIAPKLIVGPSKLSVLFVLFCFVLFLLWLSSPIHISSHQKPRKILLDESALVCTGVGSQHAVVVHVVGI